MNQLPHVKFVVNETPYCFWDINHEEKNLNFLNSIDPKYFQHIADIHKNFLDGDQKHYAAVALRITYSHALETMFALLCAMAQSHDCIVGWMVKYKNSELNKVIDKIHNLKPIKTKLPFEKITWKVLAECIFEGLKTGNDEFDLKTREAFAELWKKFAHDYLSDLHGIEYNSMKHGLRMRSGGVIFGISKEPNMTIENPTAEDFIFSPGSDFGSTFFVSEKLYDAQNFTLRQQSVNWKPEKFVAALELIALSIQNIITILKVSYGANPETFQLIYFENIDDYKTLWNYEDNFKLAFHPRIKETHIKPFTKKEIISIYDKPAKAE